MMNKISKLKKIEKQIVASLINFFSILKKVIISFIKFFLEAGSQKVTIMLIPHSEKRVFNLRINVFLLFITFLFTSGSLGIIAFISLKYYKKNELYLKTSEQTQIFEKRVREYKDLLSEVLYEHENFRTKQNLLLSKLNSVSIRAMQELHGEGGLLNPVEYQKLNQFEKEQAEVKKVILDYRYSIQAFNEINKMANKYNKILKDLPFGNPVKGVYIITSTFGFRIHPIHRVLDMHQGIDLAHIYGVPIVSTAPGIVEKVEYDIDGYGWYIKVSHKLGYSTMYAHLRSRPIVNPGDKVKKNQVIGYMGSTGASTAPHLHYEVRLGNNLLDPWPFISTY